MVLHDFIEIYERKKKDIEMSITNALLNNLSMSLKNAQAQKAQKAEEAKETSKTEKAQKQPSFGGLTNVSVNLERNADADTLVNNTKEIYKNSLKASAMLYLAGFALGFCPGLFFAATAAFLFSGKGLDFKSHLVNALSENAEIMTKFQDKNKSAEVKVEANSEAKADAKAEEPEEVEAEAPKQLAIETKQQPQLAIEGQPRLALEMHDNNATNPIIVEKQEQKPMSPLDVAQQKYAKALDNQDKAAAMLEKREKAQQVAIEKYEEAQARLEKAQAEYDKANAQMKTQMTEKITKCQEAVVTRFANANLAKERTDVAKAKLDQAQINAAIAQKQFEDLQAEDIIDID